MTSISMSLILMTSILMSSILMSSILITYFNDYKPRLMNWLDTFCYCLYSNAAYNCEITVLQIQLLCLTVAKMSYFGVKFVTFFICYNETFLVIFKHCRIEEFVKYSCQGWINLIWDLPCIFCWTCGKITQLLSDEVQGTKSSFQ